MENLEELTLTELKEIAKEKEIKNISKLKKEELIELLSNNSKTDNSEEINERYKITNEGIENLNRLKSEWNEFVNAVNTFLND